MIEENHSEVKEGNPSVESTSRVWITKKFDTYKINAISLSQEMQEGNEYGF